jgi:hypothetical protein
MEYTYEVDDKNEVTITWTGEINGSSFSRTISQFNFPHNWMPWTKEDAEQWAEETIQAIKDNGDVYDAPVYDQKEQKAAYLAAKAALES